MCSVNIDDRLGSIKGYLQDAKTNFHKHRQELHYAFAYQALHCDFSVAFHNYI